MKTLLSIMIGTMLAVAAQAETFRYQLFEDSINEFTPYVLDIEMDGGFNEGSKVKKVTLSKINQNAKNTLLFKWEKNLGSFLKFKWLAKGKLFIQPNPSSPNFKSSVKSPISNPWGDTSFNPEDEYNFGFSEIILDQDGSIGSEGFDISNSSQEESCVWGILKRI